MKLTMTCLLTLLLCSTWAHARDERIKIPLAGFFDTPDAQAKLSGDVRFFFGEQSHPKPNRIYGEFRSNKKTSSFAKSDDEACSWALLSALLSLHDRALREGGNAVINIRSNYKNMPFVSETEYECGAGGFVAGVALVGTVVSIP